MSDSKIPSHVHTMSKVKPEDSYWYQLRKQFHRDINDSGSPYELLLSKLHTLESELSALRSRVAELEDELHETWMGGNE